MRNYCEICGHINGHAYGCPEASDPKPLYYCEECGSPLYVGDEAYQVGSNYYCPNCCGRVELEEPERDWDFEYDRKYDR
jgi:DNA-directed RNA polymerase subunit RPC12/RpoP